MNEVHRLAYLDAIGVESYVSRRQLPGAAATVRTALTGAVPGAKPAIDSLAAAPGLAASLKSDAAAPQLSVNASPGRREPRQEGPVFSVLNCRVADWCWLDEIPRGREPGRDYLMLLQSIARALGWPKPAVSLERFDWPIADTRQIGNSERAARDGFRGYLHGRLERQPAAGLLLLGVADKAWFDRDSLPDLPIVKTASVWRLLRQPQLKRQVWSELKEQWPAQKLLPGR